jgi:hypothetical protein
VSAIDASLEPLKIHLPHLIDEAVAYAVAAP